jgi:hypothetical protein
MMPPPFAGILSAFGFACNALPASFAPDVRDDPHHLRDHLVVERLAGAAAGGAEQPETSA